jgi:hypothetical protein
MLVASFHVVTWIACFLATLAIAKKSPEAHYEGIVVQWLKHVKVDLNGLTEPTLAHEVIASKGWRCYATLVQLQLQIQESKRGQEVALGLPKNILDDIMRMCGAVEGGPLPITSRARPSDQFVFNRQHNGLGNQLFQFAFSRLLAESMGRRWSTSLLEPFRGEAPWKKVEYPPNSESGWALFRDIFMADEVSPSARRAFSQDANASAMCFDEAQRCVMRSATYTFSPFPPERTHSTTNHLMLGRQFDVYWCADCVCTATATFFSLRAQ